MDGDQRDPSQGTTTTTTTMTRVEEVWQLLQRERHLRQLDVQEKAKIQRARDQLALQVEALLEERLLEDGKNTAVGGEDDEMNHHGEEVQLEIEALQNDVDILLREVEEERRINKELEKMVKEKEYEKVKVDKALFTLQQKFQKLKMKKNGGEDVENMDDVVDMLKNKIDILTASQKELIASLDGSADELDTLSKENRALCDTVARLKDTCAAYERQIEEHISVAEQLQELLEEGSEWRVPQDSDKPLSIPPLRPTDVPSQTSEEEFAVMKQEYQQTLVHYKALEENLSQWQSKCAVLQNHVMALCAELTRLSGCASGMHTCIVPMLADIETRLTALV